MTTDKQIEANRRNAQRSTGPATAAGKAASSQNARKHGLTATTLDIAEQDRERYHELRRELTTEISPQGPIEQLLFERLLRAAWNLDRIAAREDDLFRQGTDFSVPERSGADRAVCPRHVSLETPPDTSGNASPEASPATPPADPLRQLTLLARYRTASERSFDRALKQLTQLQTNRALRTDVAAELPEKTPTLTDIARFAKRTRIREGIHQEPAHRIAFDRELALLGQEIKLSQQELEAVTGQ